MEHVKDTTITTITSAQATLYVIDEIYDSQYSPAQTGGEGVDLDSYITYTTTSTASGASAATGAAVPSSPACTTITSESIISSTLSVVYTNGTAAAGGNATASPGSSAGGGSGQLLTATASRGKFLRLWCCPPERRSEPGERCPI